MKLKILRRGSKAESKVITLDFTRANFDLFRDLLERIQRDTALERRELQER